MATTRYTMRRPTTDDTSACIAIHCDPATCRHRPGGAPSVAQAVSYIETWLDHWDAFGFGYWSVVVAATDQVVGFGGVMVKAVGSRRGLNLYFRLAPSVWGQGLSAVIGHAALREAFDRRRYDRVLASTRRNNIPARRALERLGMAEVETCAGKPGEQPSVIYEISRSAYSALTQSRD